MKNQGPWNISEHAFIDQTNVSLNAIWAHKNRDTKNRPEPSHAANQHVQILYWSHKNTNICANEKLYTIQRFADT
jgi:hypothetical protein